MTLNFNQEDKWIKQYYMARIQENFFSDKQKSPMKSEPIEDKQGSKSKKK